MIHVYHGDGKGKTTAAVGLALRALGNGYRVTLVQFFKGQASGEIRLLQAMEGVTILRPTSGAKFTWQMDAPEAALLKAEHGAMLAQADVALQSGACDLLILDEALGAAAYGFLEPDALLRLVRGKPEAPELVLTGRSPAPEILALADYVTEMVKIKHPFDAAIPARAGVEF
jgi:cob(I)alamin adenosyltransferase